MHRQSLNENKMEKLRFDDYIRNKKKNLNFSQRKNEKATAICDTCMQDSFDPIIMLWFHLLEFETIGYCVNH